MSDPTLASQVEQALAGELEFEPVWDALAEAIAAAPQDASLLRQRIRMAEAAGLRRERLDTLRRLVALAPGDREARRELAEREHFYAYFLVDDELDEDAQQRETERLQQQARDDYAALAAEQLHDADFVQRLFEGDDPLKTEPWRRLRLLLGAQAAAPAHAGLARLLALAWADLAGWAPRGWNGEPPFPMGFQFDGLGNLFEPLMVERALAALAPLIEQAADDLELRQQRAALNLWCGRYDDAAADHAACAATWTTRAAQAPDDDTRDDCLAQAEQAQQEAERCRGGRAAVVQGALAGMEEAVARLGALGEREHTDQALDDEARAAMAGMQDTMAQTRAEVGAGFEELRPVLLAAQEGPDEDTLATLQAMALQVARQSGGLVAFEPSEFPLCDEHSLTDMPDPWLHEVAQPLATLGWRPLGLCDNPAYRAQFGRSVFISLWVDAPGTSVAAITCAGALRLVDIESELEDGRQLITTTTRGRSNFGGVPGIDQLAADAELPITEQAALHQARLACLLAQRPGTGARPVDSLAGFTALQERQRQIKLAYRLAEGISVFEALGMPTDHPDHFVPAVRQAVLEHLRGLAQARLH